MREPHQGNQAKRFRGGLGLAFEQGFKGLDCRREIPSLEVSKTKIEAQARHLWVQAQSLMEEMDGILVMRLARLEQAKVRIGFGVIRLAAQERSPLGFGFGDLAL